MVDQTTRPAVPLQMDDEALHRRLLAMRANSSLPKDGSDGMQEPLRLMGYTVALLPDATLWESSMVYISDEVGGAVLAFSDGSDWRRATDRVIAS